MTDKRRKNDNLESLDTLLAGLMDIHEMGAPPATKCGTQAFCENVLKSACAIAGSDRGSVMLFDDVSCDLKIAAARGLSRSLVSLTHLKPGEGAAGAAFETGESVVVGDPESHPSYTGYQGRPEQKEPFVALPIRTRDKVFGVLNVHFGGDRELSASDYRVKMLSVLAAKTAITLENARLHDSLQNFYLEMVETLARVIDAKDSYTHDHAGRARRKARRIAEVLQLPSDVVRQVEYAALLHDIGKIGVRESILLKPGKLTEGEYGEIKKHPVTGYQILSPVAFLGQVAQMVLYHQERFDGRGYPEGISGRAIPLGARIVAAIDAWDAMVSDRPYRAAMKRSAALEEVRNCCGTQFDPDVVKVFLHLEKTEWKAETAGQGV